MESPKPLIPIFHIQNIFISKNRTIITNENVSKIGLRLIGEKNIKTIDLTPTWLEILPVILHSYKELGEYDEARRMAQLADLGNEALRWYGKGKNGQIRDGEYPPFDGAPEWVKKARAMKEDAA